MSKTVIITGANRGIGKGIAYVFASKGYNIFLAHCGEAEKAYETAKEMNAVPIGLVDRKTKVLKDIKKGEVITYDMVEIDKSTKLYHLRQLQEQLQAEGFWDAK